MRHDASGEEESQLADSATGGGPEGALAPKKLEGVGTTSLLMPPDAKLSRYKVDDASQTTSSRHETSSPNASSNHFNCRHGRVELSLSENVLLSHPDILEGQDLLEMILNGSLPGRDIKQLSQALISKYQNLAGVIASPPAELQTMNGLTKTDVVALKLIQCCVVNVLRQEVLAQPVLSGWDDLIDYLTVKLRHERIEALHILFLNGKNGLIADETVSQGTIDYTPAFPREIVRRCLELHAAAMVLVHNHPTGDPSPSESDKRFTRSIERAAATMGIFLHDHIIVGRFGYRSFRREGLFS